MTLSANRHHVLDYVELTVSDLEATKAFYAAAFGWAFTDYGPTYAAIRHPDGGAAEVGGMTVLEEEQRGGGPLVLLFSEDLDRSAADVEAAGGAVVDGPYPFPGGRRFHFRDPSGNVLGVWAER
jgi:predicted enzyme related to lactoylglutathione lyase